VSKSKRELSSEEKKLWRRVAEGVKTRRVLPAEPHEEEAPPPKRAREAAAPKPQAAKPRPTKPAPLQDRAGEKRVRRGRVDIGATLDLHGHTWDTAQAALARFLRAAHRRGERTVIVVTGVGRGGAGVLKRALPDWLAEPDLRALIAGYAQAHRSHGGAGAFYVFLKRAETDA
jgi:DNA-nicking Smr family endonuclease